MIPSLYIMKEFEDDCIKFENFGIEYANDKIKKVLYESGKTNTLQEMFRGWAPYC